MNTSEATHEIDILTTNPSPRPQACDAQRRDPVCHSQSQNDCGVPAPDLHEWGGGTLFTALTVPSSAVLSNVLVSKQV